MNADGPISTDSGMTVPPSLPNGRIHLLKGFTVAAAAAWTAAIGFAVISGQLQQSQTTLKLAGVEAKASLQKDMLFRHWIAEHGGVYVPVTDKTTPNPYLTNHADRDATTSSGHRLTLVDASYMNRQIQELGRQFDIPSVHLTSLKPIRPENAADAWETNALRAIEAGNSKFSSVENIDGKPQLRYMKALVIEKSCLTCHVTEGYREGEKHGGMSILVDLKPFQASSNTHNRRDLLAFGGLWLLGLCGLGGGHSVISRRWRDRDVAVARLQALEAELADFYEHAPDMFLVLDASTGKILSCNLMMLGKTGRARDRIVGLPLVSLVEPRDALRIMSALEQFRTSGEIHYLEFLLPTAHGKAIDVELNATAIFDENGSMVRGRVVLRDITEPKRLETALSESEARYRLVSEHTVDWVFWLSSDGKFLFNSPSCHRVTGHTQAEFASDPALMDRLIFPADRPLWIRHRCEVQNEHPATELEFRIVRADGAVRWLRHVCQPVHDKSNRFLGNRSSNADITEQRHAAEALERHREILSAVSDAAEKFLRASDWRNVVDVILAHLGRATGCSRVVIFERQPTDRDEVLISQIHEWGSTSMELRTNDPSVQNIPMRASGFSRWIEILGSGKTLQGNVRNFPASEQRVLMENQIHSIAVMPIMVKASWWGFMAFEDCTGERAWLNEDSDALAAVANLMGETIERQMAEQELRESEDRFRTLVGNVPAGIFVVVKNCFAYLNEQAVKFFGAETSARLIGTQVLDLVPTNLRELVSARLQKLESEHGPVPLVETVYLQVDGSPIDVEMAATAIIYSGSWSALVIFRDITERKRAENALRESEDRYRLLVEGFPDAIGIYQDDRLIFINTRGYQMFGAESPDELLGRKNEQFIHPEDLTNALDRIKRRLAGETSVYPAEVRYIRLDGKLIQAEVNIAPINFGGRAAVQFIARDITARKQAEEQLRETETIYHSLVENLPQHVFRKDLAGRFTFGNRLFCQSLGKPLIEILGKTDLDFCPPELAAKYHADDQRVFQTGESCVGEEAHQQADGKSKFVSVIKTPLMDATGKIIGLQGISWDITARKRAEEQLRKLSRAVEQSPSAIVITNTHAEIEYVNPKFTKVTGYTFDDVRGKNPSVLKSGETPDDVYRQLWQTLQRGQEWRGEFHNRKKNGTLFWEFASISPVLDDEGRTTHYLAVKEDITERKQLETQFLQAQKMESIGLLAGGVAHDFNNILAATMMHLELWQQKPDVDADSRESLSELMTLAQRAASLTRQLLLFSRQSVMQVRTLDLNEVIENLLKMLRRLIGEDIKLDWQGQSSPVGITADAGMIEQAVMNLVVNARDAMPDGGTVTISTTIAEFDSEQAQDHPDWRPGRFACLTLNDTGTGMSKDTLRHIFEPFFTTKEAGKGTGLGLATVYGIARQHQGWVVAESEIGKGSKFRFFLPLNQAVPPKTDLASQPIVLPRGNETIMLVEDDSSLRLSLGILLRYIGYTVIEAESGAAALALWASEQSRVDLLMTDMVMPDGVNGLELAISFQATKPDLKIIISSGYTAATIKPEELAAKGILYLPKPCLPAVLASTLRKCLSNSN